MNNYFNGFVSGFFLCLSLIIFYGSSAIPPEKNNTVIQRLNDLEEKIDFNYNVLNKHLVRIMAYGVKVKEGYVDGVRQPVECVQAISK
tara:strand:- start:1387 stop:1650 length:264 start_codon:yes stop_codon:yes gene_type:complete